MITASIKQLDCNRAEADSNPYIRYLTVARESDVATSQNILKINFIDSLTLLEFQDKNRLVLRKVKTRKLINFI